MKPIDGHYLFHVTSGPSAPYDTRGDVKGGQLLGFGKPMVYEPAGDCLRSGPLSVSCLGGTFESVDVSTTPPTTRTGTCEYLGPL